MQVFLTGATGYIGSAVLDAMIKGGHRVTALARDPEKAERLQAAGAATIIGELGLPKTYADAVKAADAVVHTALESSPAACREGEARARYHARRARRGKPGGRQAARVHLYVRHLGARPQRQVSGRGCAARSAGIRRVAAGPRREGVVGVFGIAPHRRRPSRNRLWRRPRPRRRSDQGRAEWPDPGRWARQESLAVHLRSRSRRALREDPGIAGRRRRHSRHRRGRRARDRYRGSDRRPRAPEAGHPDCPARPRPARSPAPTPTRWRSIRKFAVRRPVR